MPRIRRKTIKFLLVFVAAYLLLESLLWILFPVPSEINLLLQQKLPGLKEKVGYTSNAFGFRSMSMKTLEKPAGVIRIFALGASTTDQMNQNTEDLWSATLEHKLNDEFRTTGIRIEVAAWGKGGEKVFDRVRFIRYELGRYAPDLVITLEGINDLCWNGGPGYVYGGPLTRAQTKDAKKIWWVNKLKHRYSQVDKRWTLFDKWLNQRKMIREGHAIKYSADSLFENHARYEALPYREEPIRRPDPVAEFGDGIRALIDESKKQGFRLICLTQPVLWKQSMTDEEKRVLWFYVNTPEGAVRPSTMWLEREMKKYNDIQIRETVLAGVASVPLDERIPRTLETFFDDCHFTDKGSVAVAEAAFPVVRQAVAQRIRELNNF